MTNKKSNNKQLTCNICGGPRTFRYEYLNPETGKIEAEMITVGCLGHPHIRPHLWNLHPDFPKYQRLRLQQRIQREQAEKRKGSNNV